MNEYFIIIYLKFPLKNVIFCFFFIIILYFFFKNQKSDKNILKGVVTKKKWFSVALF